MRRRTRDLLIGLALALAAFVGATWQVEQTRALAGDGGQRGESLPRLICPLH